MTVYRAEVPAALTLTVDAPSEAEAMRRIRAALALPHITLLSGHYALGSGVYLGPDVYPSRDLARLVHLTVQQDALDL